MVHSFDVEVAGEYGMLEAILLNHIYFWIEKNKANEVNFYDGAYWTFNSTRAFNQLFPYVSERQIKNALKHLREEQILITGNYNKSTYDRTLWYALSKKGLSIVQKCPMEGTQGDNGKCNNVPPIPDINTYINTNKETDIIDSAQEQDSEQKENPPLDEEPIITLPLNTGEEYPIFQSNINTFEELYPAVDILQAVRAMKGWLLTNKRKRKTKRGIDRFINSWLSREQDKGGNKSVTEISQNEDTKELKGNFNKILAIYPKNEGETNAFKQYLAWLNGRNVNGKKINLSNRQMYLGVRKYVRQCESADMELRFYKNFDTLMDERLLDYIDLEE